MSVARLTNTNLYLQRLGFDAPPPPTLDTLRQLQSRHTAQFVFENLATISAEPVLIDLVSIEDKVLQQGRGGYCYELNHLFYALLLELGFDARAISGRVVMNQPEGSWTARTHRLSLVTIDEVRYITDVGFGGMVPTAPLLLDSEHEQPTPHEPYRIDKQADGYLLRAKVAGEWRPMYLFDLQRQEDIDYTVGNWYVSTHPESPFAQRLMVARTGDGWRKTLNNGSFAVHHIGSDSERRDVVDVGELIGLMQREFDLQVPESPRVRQALTRVIAPASI
ncbi:arylamine N-acetyltransferase family protein [Pseudomonas moraviensis]|jgi:N-hydroxyarylamine O-acetyltransferase|uniref:N-hydroxyarylamine O-acetyltransferase n=1 Tax=Pseudomonas moraviensis R28-S TaxID=1395516 RepID=V8RCA2_9PSED|nr:arylamine N-acetyltransferase [Pseudomonas moraviensis]ETF09165.1 N-hydroxyarylamine O-acetyltransferase [Pseudomonas moraviensis R28-S]